MIFSSLIAVALGVIMAIACAWLGQSAVSVDEHSSSTGPIFTGIMGAFSLFVLASLGLLNEDPVPPVMLGDLLLIGLIGLISFAVGYWLKDFSVLSKLKRRPEHFVPKRRWWQKRVTEPVPRIDYANLHAMEVLSGE